MVKRLLALSVTSLLALTIAACGTETEQTGNSNIDKSPGVVNSENDNKDNTMAQSENKEENNTTSSDEMGTKWAEIKYTDFELEVDYGKNKEYEAEIERNKSNDSIEADLEDELNGVDVNGEEAFNEIYPKVKKLKIDQQTSKEDAINQTLEAFDLESNYNKFELEITFEDGTKIEYEDRK